MKPTITRLLAACGTVALTTTAALAQGDVNIAAIAACPTADGDSTNTLHVFSKDGAKLGDLQLLASGAPTSITSHPSLGILYVTSRGDGDLLAIDVATMQYVDSVEVHGAIDAAIDSAGTTLVAITPGEEASTYHVIALDSDGHFAAVTTMTGEGAAFVVDFPDWHGENANRLFVAGTIGYEGRVFLDTSDGQLVNSPAPMLPVPTGTAASGDDVLAASDRGGYGRYRCDEGVLPDCQLKQVAIVAAGTPLVRLQAMPAASMLVTTIADPDKASTTGRVQLYDLARDQPRYEPILTPKTLDSLDGRDLTLAGTSTALTDIYVIDLPQSGSNQPPAVHTIDAVEGGCQLLDVAVVQATP